MQDAPQGKGRTVQGRKDELGKIFAGRNTMKKASKKRQVIENIAGIIITMLLEAWLFIIVVQHLMR